MRWILFFPLMFIEAGRSIGELATELYDEHLKRRMVK